MAKKLVPVSFLMMGTCYNGQIATDNVDLCIQISESSVFPMIYMVALVVAMVPFGFSSVVSGKLHID